MSQKDIIDIPKNSFIKNNSIDIPLKTKMEIYLVIIKKTNKYMNC